MTGQRGDGIRLKKKKLKPEGVAGKLDLATCFSKKEGVEEKGDPNKGEDNSMKKVFKGEGVAKTEGTSSDEIG